MSCGGEKGVWIWDRFPNAMSSSALHPRQVPPKELLDLGGVVAQPSECFLSARLASFAGTEAGGGEDNSLCKVSNTFL